MATIAVINEGPQGPPGGAGGADGQDGLSAYELAVEEGFEGSESEWLDSLKGDASAYLTPDLIGGIHVTDITSETPIYGGQHVTDL